MTIAYKMCGDPFANAISIGRKVSYSMKMDDGGNTQGPSSPVVMKNPRRIMKRAQIDEISLFVQAES
jgi:hypothetical protein